ncbi:MAG: D-Ala-D-Ala dipeptidase [Alphaproteobacteria bacterium]|nr:D-Ala-D-Ala dipeptidase [Alphaproteobacteria bacterium]
MESIGRVQSETLIPMEPFADKLPLRVELAYAREDNTLFGERIYRPQARLFLYKDLAEIVCGAAARLGRAGYRLILYDGLRTMEAQARMLETARVRANPHWLEEPRLLSPPGAGAHPRGMAVDCGVETEKGVLLNMGTVFDFLADSSAPAHNPAHRDYPHLSEEVRRNRAVLDMVMRESAVSLGSDLFPLPQEWWDFRLPPSFYERFAPLSDSDLPEEMRMAR